MIKNYLVVSSVIFHLLILLSLFWVIPFLSRVSDISGDNVASYLSPEVGTVKDVTSIERDGVRYNGYKLELDGKDLYVSGSGDKLYRVGDDVDLSISEHPYGPLNTLMVSIHGVSR